MKDLISRQAAINVVCEWGTNYERQGIFTLPIAKVKQELVDMLYDCERKDHEKQ